MTKKKTSPLALAFATATAALLVGGIYMAQGSDFMTDEEGAAATLKAAELTPISIGGYSPLGGCGRGEFWATHYVAQNRSGQTVSGTVCKTLFGAQRITYE